MKNNLRDLRERKGLTLQELASKVDMNFQSLSRIELGTQDPSAIHIVKLADFFNVTIDFILHHEAIGPPLFDIHFDIHLELKKEKSTLFTGCLIEDLKLLAGQFLNP